MNNLKKRYGKLPSSKNREKNLLEQFSKTLYNLFPNFNQWLENIPDPRQEKKCEYGIKELLWLSLLLFLTSQESRQQYNHQLLTQETRVTLESMLGLDLPSLPHGDTLCHLWEKLEIEALDKLKVTLLKVLIRRRCLERFRFKRTYLIAIDGVEIYRWKQRHCEHCLHSKSSKGEGEHYYHRVLEAKLVSSCGLSLSIASEFIENTQDNVSKQDCELKAFYRLSKKLKVLFPQLKMTLLADGLYPKGPVFEICSQFNWDFMIVLQDGSLTTLWEDFEGLMNMGDYAIGAKDTLPLWVDEDWLYRWQNKLDYQGQDFEGTLNLLEISKLDKQTGAFERRRAFVTSHRLMKEELKDLEKIGQQRWKIENQGFDVQKHHGYALEHVYARDAQAMKVVYQLIQIAHLLNQLVLKADILGVFSEIENLKSYAKWFTQALNRGISFGIDELNLMKSQVQIRWETG